MPGLEDPRRGRQDAVEENRWDEDFADPSADIELISTDGVRLRIHSWYLKRRSPFFEDLLGLHKDQSAFSRTPVELPASHQVVRSFAAFTYSWGRASSLAQFAEYLEGLQLADFLRMPDLQASWLDALSQSDCVLLYSWEAFVLASRTGHMALARQAISGFATSGSGTPAAEIPFCAGSGVSEVPHRWMIALIKARLGLAIKQVGEQYPAGQAYVVFPWPDAATRFRLDSSQDGLTKVNSSVACLPTTEASSGERDADENWRIFF